MRLFIQSYHDHGFEDNARGAIEAAATLPTYISLQRPAKRRLMFPPTPINAHEQKQKTCSQDIFLSLFSQLSKCVYSISHEVMIPSKSKRQTPYVRHRCWFL